MKMAFASDLQETRTTSSKLPRLSINFTKRIDFSSRFANTSTLKKFL